MEEQKRLIKDPKAMTLMMLGIAAAFAPYAGYGWAAFQVMPKDYAGPVRVEAATKLAKDPNAETEAALIEAASDRSWKVRVAALEVLARRDDPRLADTAVPPLIMCERTRSSTVKLASLETPEAA